MRPAPSLVTLACLGMTLTGCATHTTKSPSPESLVGASLAQVRQTLSLTADPAPGGGQSYGERFYRLKERGIWIFFNTDNTVYTVRLDAPYSGPVHGIRIGDSHASLTAKLGEPKKRLAEGSVYAFESGPRVRYDFDAADKVVRILILADTLPSGHPPPIIRRVVAKVPPPPDNTLGPEKVAAVNALRDYIQGAVNQPKFSALDGTQHMLAVPFAAWAATLFDSGKCPDTGVFAVLADTYMTSMAPVGRTIWNQPDSYKKALVDAVMEIEAARPPSVNDLTAQICQATGANAHVPVERKDVRELIEAPFSPPKGGAD